MNALSHRCVRAYLDEIPNFISSPVLKGYRKYLIYKTKFSARISVGNEFDAPLYPFRLYNVAPNQIKCTEADVPAKFTSCCVKDGDWDKRTSPFDSRQVYQYFVDRFVDGKARKCTDYYNFVMETVKKGNEVSGCRSKECAEQLFEEYDQLYHKIAAEGYKTQREIHQDFNPELEIIHDNTLFPPVFQEVTVDVTRSGEFIWVAGQHRISIARILNIDTIPVRIRCRHERWQRKRDRVWNDPGECETDDRNHPDLAPLIKERASIG